MIGIPGNFENALKTLRDEEHRILALLANLQREADNLQSQLEKVRAAVSSLTGEKATKTPGRQRGNRGGTSTDDVVAHVRRALEESEQLRRDDIKAFVAAALLRDGKSRAGLGLILRRALQRPDFVETEGLYRLANAPQRLDFTKLFS